MIGSPSIVAYIVIFSWPLVAIYLFSSQKFERAIIWSVVGSFLFLPNLLGFDLPGVPAMDKFSLPSLAMLVLVAAKAPKQSRFRILPDHPVGKILLLMLLGGAVATAVSNQDPYWVGVKFLPGTTLYDAISEIMRLVFIIAPFLVGWQYLSDVKSHEEILRILVAVGLFYSILILVEVRMSPQIHTWIYGYRVFDFAQQFRDGGFRPVVFVHHGLVLAFFVMSITVAAAALWRQTRYQSDTADASNQNNTAKRYLYITAYFGVILVLCKSLGSLIFGLFLIPLVLLTRPKTQLLVAVVLAGIAIAYPILRGSGFVPIETISETVYSYDYYRGESLDTRLTNEERLLEHANKRPVFGWGGWGRWRLYNPQTGEDTTISDGIWVIMIANYGWFGYLAYFGLLGAPILAIWWRMRRRTGFTLPPVTSALCLLVAINMIELLPNSSLPPWTWLIAGALLGYSRVQAETRSEATPSATDPANQPRTVLRVCSG